MSRILRSAFAWPVVTALIAGANQVYPFTMPPSIAVYAGFTLWFSALLVTFGTAVVEWPALARIRALYGAKPVSLLIVFVAGGIASAVVWSLVIPRTPSTEPPKMPSVGIPSSTAPEPPTPQPLKEPFQNGGSGVTDEKKQPNRKKQTSTGPQSPNISGNNNRVVYNNAPAMQPSVEGITWTSRPVPSKRDDAPYAIELTLQTKSDVSPFGVAVITSAPIVGGDFHVIGQSMMLNVATGSTNENPDRSYAISFTFPPVTPRTPVIVTVYGKQAFGIAGVTRMPTFTP